jgi:hypothetical protein
MLGPALIEDMNGRPLTPEEVEKINGLILEVGFKFPDLWDHDFVASLRAGDAYPRG